MKTCSAGASFGVFYFCFEQQLLFIKINDNRFSLSEDMFSLQRQFFVSMRNIRNYTEILK